MTFSAAWHRFKSLMWLEIANWFEPPTWGQPLNKGQKALLPKCPLLGGSTVNYKILIFDCATKFSTDTYNHKVCWIEDDISAAWHRFKSLMWLGISNWFEPPTRGQPLNKGQKLRSKVSFIRRLHCIPVQAFPTTVIQHRSTSLG